MAKHWSFSAEGWQELIDAFAASPGLLCENRRGMEKREGGREGRWEVAVAVQAANGLEVAAF